MDFNNLTDVEILGLQYSILEEIKQKQNNISTITTANNANDFVYQRFTDNKGNIENDTAYICRITWFEQGFPKYKQLSEITGNTEKTIQNISSTYNWKNIKMQAIDLGWIYKEDISNQMNTVDTSKKEITRDSPEYKRYREKVLKRDGICQCCGNKYNLEVHHPLPYNQYPSLRADTSNGIVLCKECHDEYHHKHGYKECANPVTLAQFLRDYGMNTQSKLLNYDLMQGVDDIVEDFVNTLFISPYTHINTFKEDVDDISEDRWSICIDGAKWDTYIPVSEVRHMFYTYIHYLNNQKGVSVNIAYNTHKVKQAMERQGFTVITKNVYNEEGERSSIRVWDKCMLHPTNWDKLNEGVV